MFVPSQQTDLQKGFNKVVFILLASAYSRKVS